MFNLPTILYKGHLDVVSLTFKTGRMFNTGNTKVNVKSYG